MGQEAGRRADRMLSGSGGQAESAAWRGADNQKRPAGRGLGDRLHRPQLLLRILKKPEFPGFFCCEALSF